MSPVLLIVGVAAVAAALLVLALVVLPAGPGRVPLSRLDPSLAPPTSAFAGAGAAAGAAVEKVLVKRGRLAAGADALERAGMSTTLPDFVLAVGVVTVVSGALGLVLGGPLLGLLVVVAVPFGAKLLLKFRAGRRQAAFADQLDDSLQLMAGSLRAGHSLLRAVDSVSQEADAPTSEEFSRIVNETRVGRDLNDSLDEVAERMGSDDFTWVAQAIRRQVKALSAEGKLSAIVLMALPFGVTAFISITNPAYLAKFTESAMGYGMLGVAGMMLLVGGLWLKKTVAIRF
jgi:tight adherence protein B